MSDCEPEAGRRRQAYAGWHYGLGLLAVYVVVVGLLEVKLWRPGTVFDGSTNCQIAEAQSWWNGRLDLTERAWDTASIDGRTYSHFPLMFTLLSAVVVPFCDGVPYWLMLLVVGIIPLLAYVLFHRLSRSPMAATLLAVGLVCGTSMWPVISKALWTASPYFVNHVLACVGLLILLVELFGRQRVWVAGIGLLVATLSRQLTIAFAIPLIWMAFRQPEAPRRRRQVGALAVVGLIVVGVPAVANTVKFGHPLNTGYMAIYEGRDEPFARDAQEHGLFSAHFVPRNLWYMNLGFPKLYRIEMAGETEYHLQPNITGTGIWWTTPLLLWLFFDFRRILRDGASRLLLVAAVIVFVALMFFHTTGAEQRGFNRFSLDFLPVLLALVGLECLDAKRRWLSFAMVSWSVVYFRWLI
ncbi:MAG: hypothetical protein KJ749_14800 [Planctomycetes bacterium]|nr:hypothetical protein [Planctomycetota bacterium]